MLSSAAGGASAAARLKKTANILVELAANGTPAVCEWATHALAATAEAARPVRKALLVRADELCARVDRLSLMQQGEG